MRWLLYLFSLLIALLLFGLLSLWLVFKQPAVFEWVANKIIDRIEFVQVDKIKGSLLDGLAISNLVVQQENYALVIDEAYFHWQWQALWQEQLNLAQLKFNHIAVDVAATQTESSLKDDNSWQEMVLPDIALPLAVQLQQLTINRLSLYTVDSTLIELSDVAVSVNAQDKQLVINQVYAAMSSPIAISLSVQGEVGLEAPHAYQLQLNSDVFEPEWLDARTEVMVVGDAQSLVAHTETMGDAAAIGPILAETDWWLDREQACSLETKIITRLGQFSAFNVQANWVNELSLSGILRVDAYQNTLIARGDWLPQPNMQLSVDAVNLNHFNRLLPISGQVKASGKLQGSWQSPEGELNLQGKSLSWQQHAIDKLSVTALANLTSLTAEIKAFQLSDLGKNSEVKLALTGSLAQHQLNLTAKAMQSQLSFKLAGGLNEDWRWLGKLDGLQVIQPEAGLWQQSAASQLSASSTAFNLLSPLCLSQLSTKACLSSALWTPQQGVRLSGKLDEFYLSRLNKWLPKTLKLPGKAHATFEYKQHKQQRQAQLALRLPANHLDYHTLSGKQQIDYETILIDANLVNDVITSKLEGKLTQGVSLNLNSVNRLDKLDLLSVTGKFDIANMGIAQPFLTEVNGLSGRLHGDFALAGNLNKPQLSSQIELTSLTLTPVASGVTFEVPKLFLDIKPTGSVYIDGNLLAGKGKANLRGWGSVADLSRWTLDVLIEGKDLYVANTPQAEIWLSPNIQLSATPQQIEIIGQLIVPKALLRVQSYGSKAVALSNDVLIVGEAEQQSKIQVIPKLRVLLGDEISLSGSGLKTGLSGQLQLTQSRLGQLLLQGEVATKSGSFRAYQQDLTIEQGRIIFNGVTDNPGLMIIATRKVFDETVGVRVEGSLIKPRLSVFSRPVMPQTDALGLLVLGKRAKDMTATDAALLATKLATESDEDPLLQRLGQDAGLDVGLTNIKGEKNTGLSLGKRLTPDLYVRYVVGAFEYGARLITEYRINRLFSVEVQTGQQSSGDIFYRFETD